MPTAQGASRVRGEFRPGRIQCFLYHRLYTSRSSCLYHLQIPDKTSSVSSCGLLLVRVSSTGQISLSSDRAQGAKVCRATVGTTPVKRSWPGSIRNFRRGGEISCKGPECLALCLLRTMQHSSGHAGGQSCGLQRELS